MILFVNARFISKINYNLHYNKMLLVQSLNWSHGGLDMKRLDVLPVLLEQGDQEVHGQVDVLDELLLSHADIAHGHTQAQHLLHLELDGGLEVQSLLLQVVAVSDQGGELASLEITMNSKYNRMKV